MGEPDPYYKRIGSASASPDIDLKYVNKLYTGGNYLTVDLIIPYPAGHLYDAKILSMYRLEGPEEQDGTQDHWLEVAIDLGQHNSASLRASYEEVIRTHNAEVGRVQALLAGLGLGE